MICVPICFRTDCIQSKWDWRQLISSLSPPFSFMRRKLLKVELKGKQTTNHKHKTPAKKNPKSNNKTNKPPPKTRRNNLFYREKLKLTRLQMGSVEYRLNTKISNTSIKQQYLYICNIYLHQGSLHSSYSSQFESLP